MPAYEMRISDWSSGVCSSDLLVSHTPGRLLPTIRSRCRMRRFHPLDAEDVDRAIAAERSDLSADERTAMVRIAEGAPGRALRYAGLDIAGLTASIERIEGRGRQAFGAQATLAKSLARSEEHTSELQSLMRISYAVFCLK